MSTTSEKESISSLVSFLWLLIWISGVILAKGFWSTTFAMTTVGFWSAYLVLERVMIALGVIA